MASVRTSRGRRAFMCESRYPTDAVLTMNGADSGSSVRNAFPPATRPFTEAPDHARLASGSHRQLHILRHRDHDELLAAAIRSCRETGQIFDRRVLQVFGKRGFPRRRAELAHEARPH